MSTQLLNRYKQNTNTKKIKAEKILVNDIKTKSKYTLKHEDKITIFI